MTEAIQDDDSTNYPLAGNDRKFQGDIVSVPGHLLLKVTIQRCQQPSCPTSGLSLGVIIYFFYKIKKLHK